MRRRLLLAVLIVAALGSGAAIMRTGGLDGGAAAKQAAAQAPRRPMSAAPGSAARFAYLTAQRSNRCDLQAAEILARPGGGRLQGSCCNPMDLASYRSQVTALAGYRSIAEIPHDPYDIPVSLAKRLLRFRDSVKLTARQRATYRRAMALSRLKGPCCCRCWRWEAFRGLSYHLIAAHHMSTPRLATLIEALDGCGGSSPPPGSDIRSS